MEDLLTGKIPVNLLPDAVLDGLDAVFSTPRPIVPIRPQQVACGEEAGDGFVFSGEQHRDRVVIVKLQRFN